MTRMTVAALVAAIRRSGCGEAFVNVAGGEEWAFKAAVRHTAQRVVIQPLVGDERAANVETDDLLRQLEGCEEYETNVNWCRVADYDTNWLCIGIGNS